MAAFAKRAKAIRIAVFDVDGVLTDGRIYFGPAGEAMKAFDIQDGLGLKLLGLAGIKVAILTGRTSKIVAQRVSDLQLDDVIQGAADKGKELQRLLKRHKLDASACAYMGDDLPDLPAMRLAGLVAAPANAVRAVRKHAHVITKKSGGRGAAREFVEAILLAQGRRDLVDGLPRKG
ncbi:hypothetical protein BWI17_04950 [Betaproteobacteria bacterium GR16-43]|nr:hypothetical protein BWI17_04950 [Betaproteobacteria bacterium GR16-43]